MRWRKHAQTAKGQEWLEIRIQDSTILWKLRKSSLKKEKKLMGEGWPFPLLSSQTVLITFPF